MLMPKLVMERLKRDILEDIERHFPPGSHYRTIREIGRMFGVSEQTVQRAVRDLTIQKLLAVKDRSGIFVLTKVGPALLDGKTIMVVSANADPRFNEAFLRGIKGVAGPLGIATTFRTARNMPVESLEFGETLCEEYDKGGVIGLIALSFRNADLPFYHLISTGHLVVSDVMSHGLRDLPSVQSDNRRHSAEAAWMFADQGKTNILVASYWPEGNTRHITFAESFASLVPEGRCTYVHLSDELSTADLYMFFRGFTSRHGVFAIDYAANHTVAPYFVSQQVSPVNNLIVYDSEFETFSFPGLLPVRSAAPSLLSLGDRLAEKLIERIRTGAWSEPLHELV